MFTFKVYKFYPFFIIFIQLLKFVNAMKRIFTKTKKVYEQLKSEKISLQKSHVLLKYLSSIIIITSTGYF